MSSAYTHLLYFMHDKFKKITNFKIVLYGPSNITIVLEAKKVPGKVEGVLDLSINQY